MNNQFELFPTNINEVYSDQASTSIVVGDRRISASYTPHGVRELDSEYCALIHNIDDEVKQVYAINRPRKKFTDRNGYTYESDFNFETSYDPIELNKGCGVLGIRVEWVNGKIYDFKSDNRPVFNVETKMTDKNQLIQEIKNNPHLHVLIKENLLSNIKQ